MDSAYYTLCDIAGRDLTERTPLFPDTMDGKNKALAQLANTPGAAFVCVWRPALEGEGLERAEQMAVAERTIYLEQDKRGRVLGYKAEFYKNCEDLTMPPVLATQASAMFTLLLQSGAPLHYFAIGVHQGLLFPIYARTTLFKPVRSNPPAYEYREAVDLVDG